MTSGPASSATLPQRKYSPPALMPSSTSAGNGTATRCVAVAMEQQQSFGTTSRPRGTHCRWRSSSPAFGSGAIDLQSAVYQEAAVAAGWPDERLTFIVISTVYPHHCHVVRLPYAAIRRARDRALRYLLEIRQRTEFDHWLPDDYGRSLSCQ